MGSAGSPMISAMPVEVSKAPAGAGVGAGLWALGVLRREVRATPATVEGAGVSEGSATMGW